jgi:hypothetical protein
MDRLFKQRGQKILVYVSVQQETDPYEHTSTSVFLNPVPVDAIVSDLMPSQIMWKMPGLGTSQAKELFIPKDKKDVILVSAKIEIDGEIYLGWKGEAGRQLQIKDLGDLIQLYVYKV